jgi:hypothetical protein
MRSPEIPLGEIKIETHLPEVFIDESLKGLSQASLEGFKAEHGGNLPLKFRVEEFCFQRSEQVCTADTDRKYIAWAAGDKKVEQEIFGALADTDIPLVLRSHSVSYGLTSPVLQMVSPELIGQHRDFLNGTKDTSKVEDEFFKRLDRDNTVVQLIKNAYPQKGLFLVRPTFIYDEALRSEIRSYQDKGSQYVSGDVMDIPGMPREFAGLRVVPLDEFAREKKDRLGAMFTFNHETGKLSAQGGFPHEAKWQLEGAWKDKERGLPTGRTLDLETSTTELHHSGDLTRQSVDSAFVNPQDIQFLEKVLAWQMPRIAKFEDEIRRQDWIPQGLTNTHQFIIFPPQEIGRPEINTQYFDFRTHESREEMDQLTSGGDFEQLSAEEKILRFF